VKTKSIFVLIHFNLYNLWSKYFTISTFEMLINRLDWLDWRNYSIIGLHGKLLLIFVFRYDSCYLLFWRFNVQCCAIPTRRAISKKHKCQNHRSWPSSVQLFCYVIYLFINLPTWVSVNNCVCCSCMMFPSHLGLINLIKLTN